jgi:para-nitrobenzyl esterase
MSRATWNIVEGAIMKVRWRELLRPSLRTSFAIYVLLVAMPGAAANTGPVVAVTGGQVLGASLEKGGAVFKGIPFAQPPVGALRWRAPMPVTPWMGVRDATAFGNPCMQGPQFIRPPGVVAKEDCLYLNIWTPEWPSRSKKPVMVWIHGGGNYFGSGSTPTYDSDSLARHGVVLVTLNYRLGNLGFFSHPALTRESPHHASGNQGILDQIAALKWVRDNIARFGGDPGNVTIFGESAGSLDVSVLMTTPLSRGLFKRVIGESGSVVGIGDALTLEEAEKNGAAAAARWGLAAAVSAKDMRGVPADDILKADPNFAQSHPDLGITVDGYVFPRSPAAVFASGKEHRVGLLHGNNSRERIPGTNPPDDLKKAIVDSYGPFTDRGWALYSVAATDPSYGTPADQWADDTSFRCSAVAQLAWHAAAGNRTFEYEFTRVPAGREAVGATHASELAYVFGTLDRGGFVAVVGPQPSGFSETDRQVSTVLQQYWTNFAKTGNPNGGQLAQWPKFDAASRAYIQFTDAGPISKEGLRRPFCNLFIENAKRRMGR